MKTQENVSILVVDDTPINLSLIANLLTDQYQVRVANNGVRALELAIATLPDLILLDIMMPDMDGYEVCRRLKSDPRTERIPVIFLSAKTGMEDEEQGLLLGAADFIHKPISPSIVQARVKTHLQAKDWQDFIEGRNACLKEEVERRLSEVSRLLESSIQIMVALAEFRDQRAGHHIRRTQEYTRLLAEKSAQLPKHAAYLTTQRIELIAKAAPLHDVGKIAIPEHILLKPGKLTEEEFDVVKTHALRGHDMLRTAGESSGEQGDFLSMALDIARCHHEKWDGTGYPDGLAGEQIPLAARLMAVADVFDALTASRCYKAAMPHEQAAAVIAQGSGAHFDPQVVEVFLEIQDEFKRVASLWIDR